MLFCCLESHESDGHAFLAWQPRLREAGRRRTERAVCPPPGCRSRADTISWPYPACCVAADLSSCTTATRPSAPDTSCLSAAAARGALRWQLGPRRDCRLRACGCGVLLARGGADSSPPCTGAGVGELKRATAAVSSPAAPCCRQLCLAPHAQVSGLSALTAGGTSLPTSAECFHTGSRLGGGPARCGGRRGDVFGIKNHPVCHQQPPPACHSRLVGFRYSALYPWGVFGMAE